MTFSLTTSPTPSGQSRPPLGRAFSGALAFLGILALLSILALPALAGVGGGWTNAGPTGQYYANSAFSGSPAFSRKDVRLDFGTSVSLPPGGVGQLAEQVAGANYSGVGATNWSAKWTGSIIPRFSENYTFKVYSSGTLTLKIAPHGSSLVTILGSVTGAQSVTYYGMTAGQAYDVEVDFAQGSGPWGLSLHWDSPSTPEEPIETLDQVGIVNPDTSTMFADLVKGGGSGYATPSYAYNYATNTYDFYSQLDPATGWPTTDGGDTIQQTLDFGLDINPLMIGVVNYSFSGQATAGTYTDSGGSTPYPALALQGNVGTNLSSSYDSGQNTTYGSFNAQDDPGWGATTFYFYGTKRSPGDSGVPPGDGVTNLHLWWPGYAPASGYAPAAVFIQPVRDNMSHFELIRFQLYGDQETAWSDRTTPFYAQQNSGKIINNSPDGIAWEYKILLANETGRDLMLSVPTLANQDYHQKLAQLLKYGSDATGTPYTTFQANPVYPPLNSNLRVYLEVENELWNFGTIDNNNLIALLNQNMNSQNANWRALNYDGGGNSGWREAMLLAVTLSNDFRAVWGDSAMPGTSANPVVRPLYEWQYDDQQGTASNALIWADHYYGNSDNNQKYANPHPLNYFLWGGGGATYYSASNPDGITTALSTNNGHVDDFFAYPTALSAGYHPNANSGDWQFSGTAGIAVPNGGDIPPAFADIQYPDGFNDTGYIPSGFTPTQEGYITDNGSATIQFTIPAAPPAGTPTPYSNVYAVCFKAAQHLTNGTPDNESFRVFLDGVDTTIPSRGQGNYDGSGHHVYTPLPDWYHWKAFNIPVPSANVYYYTNTFTASPGSAHTLTIQGEGDVAHNNPNQTVFLGAVEISGIDAIFASNFPSGGQANGQPASGYYVGMLQVEANWAKAFGLSELSYEGGWSLGGDDNGSALQNYAKFADPRTPSVQKTTFDEFYQAGNAVQLLGTYETWPTWQDYIAHPQSSPLTSPVTASQLANISLFPLVQEVDAYGSQLPAEATNGTVISIPTMLSYTSAQLSTSGYGTVYYQSTYPGGWYDWNILVPATGVYNFSTDAAIGGTQAIFADGNLLGSGPSAAAMTSAPYQVTLTKGLHAVRVACTQALTEPQGSHPGFGFSNLIINPGPAPAVGPVLEAFGFWFDKGDGEATGKNPTSLAPGVTGSTISRGGGVGPSPANNGFANYSSGSGANYHYASSAAQALTTGQYPDYSNEYSQFTLTPPNGKSVNISSLGMKAYFDAVNGNPRFDPGVVVTYSINGGPFTTAASLDGNVNQPVPQTFNLSGISALQNLSLPVTFRIYLYDNTAMSGNTTQAASGFGLNNSDNSIIVYGTVNPVATTASATFVQKDTTTQGSWKGVYGYDGFNVSQDISPNNPTYPAYATVAFSNKNDYTWTSSTTDPTCLQKAAVGSTDRMAGTWYSNSGVNSYTDIDVYLTDGKTHQVAVYCLDFDIQNARQEKVQVLDASSLAVLDTEAISSFHSGNYLVWNVKGHVKFRTTYTGGAQTGQDNSVVSGVFFDPPAASATFVQKDTVTQGNWKSIYGADGFYIPQDADANNPTIPSYATVSITPGGLYTWAASTTDVRAPQKTAISSTDRIAGCWYSNTGIGSYSTFDVNITDGGIHQVALYCLDWDGTNQRSQTINVLNANTLAVLSSQTLTSFTPGDYLVWNVKGHVQFQVVNNGTAPGSLNDSVVSALFFDPDPTGAPGAPASLTATPGNAQVALSWPAPTGTVTSYRLYRGTTSGSETLYQSQLTARTYTDTAVTNGTTYYYKVAALDSGLASAQSPEANAKPVAPPGTPTGVTAVAGASGTKKITVSWTTVSGATGYTVYRSLTSGGTYSSVGTSTTTSYVNTGLTAGTTYYYKVAATNAGGTSAQSAYVSAKAQ